MPEEETPLQREERHVAESLGRLDRQRVLVARLKDQASVGLQAAQIFLADVEQFHLLAVAHLEMERAKIVPPRE